MADDDKDFLNVTRSVLEFAGFKVDTAENGEEALKEIKRHRYDLLIMDVIMPNIDGVKLFQMVKKSKRHRDVPVLFISGYPVWTELEERKREIVTKADAFIQKPFKTKVFMDTVKALSDKDSALKKSRRAELKHSKSAKA
ncbi:MAG: response regulator [Candidatus Hydrogenedentota bacterium]|nr:MAG: response regulator [Candidatus Hydrogenedentota bacterium]